jgi:hypothetical protein
MSQTIPDFTDDERHTVTQTLFERYMRVTPLEVADADVELIPESGVLNTVPCMYWEGRGAHFVVFKLGDNRFRGQFFYNDAQQYGTGHEFFDSLGDCVVTLLRIQSDHERQMERLREGLSKVEATVEDDGNPIII